MKKIISMVLAAILLSVTLIGCGSSGAQAPAEPVAEQQDTQSTGGNKVMIYSSMQEAQLQAIKKAFEEKYPDITMDYYFASGGKVMTKMTTEAQSGQIDADIVWLGDPSDYEGFKKAGYLQQYTSPESDHIASNYIDKDGYYTAARLVTMGIAWSTLDGIGIDDSEAPKTWDELLDEKWKGQIVMTDPAQASTTKYWMAAMMQNPNYGEEFFQKLHDNGCELESGTTSTHNQVAAGSYKVGICLDYVSANLISEGSPMNFHYTDTDVVTMTSPVGLIANCANPENGKKLYDFILSKEGQEILVANNLVSVRDDVKNSVDTSAIAEKNVSVDFDDLADNTQNYLDQFNKIWNK